VLRRYEAAWLPRDLLAGLVLRTMLVPVGIAYASRPAFPESRPLRHDRPAARVRALRPSRILVLGPDSSLAAVILAVVLPLSAGDPARAVALASMMAIVSGWCASSSAAALGFVTELLSKPIRYGYMNGIALTVLISQLPKLFGFSIESAGPRARRRAIAEAVRRPVNWTRSRSAPARSSPSCCSSRSSDSRHPDRGRRRDDRGRRARPRHSAA
jgi:MFS superfamily sulfate permease-like transporter